MRIFTVATCLHSRWLVELVYLDYGKFALIIRMAIARLVCHSQKKIARRCAHRACRVSVSPASILIPRADHPQCQRPSSPRPVPPTALSTHQAPSPLPVPFFFLLTLPLTSSSSSSPSSPILLHKPPKFDSLHRQQPTSSSIEPQPGWPNPSSEQSP